MLGKYPIRAREASRAITGMGTKRGDGVSKDRQRSFHTYRCSRAAHLRESETHCKRAPYLNLVTDNREPKQAESESSRRVVEELHRKIRYKDF